MRLWLRLRGGFARKNSQSDYDYNRVTEFKFNELKRCSGKYDSSNKFKHEDILY